MNYSRFLGPNLPGSCNYLEPWSQATLPSEKIDVRAGAAVMVENWLVYQFVLHIASFPSGGLVQESADDGPPKPERGYRSKDRNPRPPLK